MHTLLEDILYNRRRSTLTLPLRALLRVFSAVYGTIVSLRAFLYSRGMLHVGSIPCRVVSIGNITVGGTGKTPIVIMTARMLSDAGYRTVVVSRGYRRKSDGPLVVSDGTTVLVPATESGDEPHIVASSLPGVPVVVGSRRYEAAMLAWERFSPDIILLDDAFQHRAIHRDIDIVTIDAVHPFGSGMLLPRGTLRESPRVLNRARAVLITRFDGDVPSPDLEHSIRRFHPGVGIFYSRHIPVALRRFPDGETFAPENLAGRTVAALSNIANPASFHEILKSFGAKIVWTCVRPDHHRYRPGEPEEIGHEARTHGASLVVMTAKDERDIPEDAGFGETEAMVLDIETALIGREEEYLALVAPNGKGTRS